MLMHFHLAPENDKGDYEFRRIRRVILSKRKILKTDIQSLIITFTKSLKHLGISQSPNTQTRIQNKISNLTKTNYGSKKRYMHIKFRRVTKISKSSTKNVNILHYNSHSGTNHILLGDVNTVNLTTSGDLTTKAKDVCETSYHAYIKHQLN